MKKFYEDEQYIKMCRKAEEIQAIRFGKMSDPINDIHLEPDFTIQSNGIRSIRAIWLPRQDQLQEMIYEGYTYTPKKLAYMDISTLTRIVVKKEGGYVEYYKQFETFEQLYLAIVMKEKFNKTWDNIIGVWE